MGSLKKFDGSSWINSNLRKLTTDTDTFTTFPAIIYAEGTNATVGLKGNTVQSGTPTPDSPVMPQGTGEKTGNLFDIPDIVSTGYYVVDTDKLYSAITSLKAEQYYTLSWDYLSNGTTGVINQLRLTNGSGTIKTIQSGKSFTLTQSNISNATDIVAYFGSNATGGSMKHFMLNEGSTALPYEPWGVKIPISSANTTTPVYLDEVQTTRKIRKLVLTGGANEDLRKNNQDPSNYLYYLRLTVDNIGARDCLCTHLMWIAGAPTDSIGCNANLPRIIYMNFGADIMDAQTSGNTVEGLKEYLAAQYAAGTPVTIWYVLATEETAVVNEPLMKISDYADTLSNVSIPVTAGENTISIGTTVQPSEVTANYYGWHTITVHECESGQWD